MRYILILIVSLSFNQGYAQSFSEMIGPKEFEKTIIKTSDSFLIDLRTDQEVQNGMIEGAVQLDYKSESFASNLNYLDKSKTYFIYCAAGGRSAKAASMMQELGFKKIYDLKGGVNAWLASGRTLHIEEEL